MTLRQIIAFAVLAALAPACHDSGQWWEPVSPGSVVVQERSPDLTASALVIAREQPGHYLVEIRDEKSRKLLASRTMTAPVGYHAHLVTLSWSQDARRVTATVDRDFGEANLVFELER